MVTIPEFLRATAAAPFAWGRNDCALWAGALVLARTGFDPAADLRGRYDSAFGCRRLVMAAGGLDALIRPRMTRFAEGETQDGVCLARWGGQSICGILSGGRLVLKTPRGHHMPAPGAFLILRGWSI